MITKFEEVKSRGSKNVKCAGGCGKRVRRERTFTQTINPFNKNPDGTVKTSEQVQVAVSEERKQWEAGPEFCTGCLAKQGAA